MVLVFADSKFLRNVEGNVYAAIKARAALLYISFSEPCQKNEIAIMMTLKAQ